MKKILTILTIIFIAATIQVSAQTKKTKARKKPAATQETIVAKRQAYTQPAESKKATVVASKRSTATDGYYTTALGLKFLYGISLTAKHFINDKAALEAVIQYRNHSGFGSEVNLTALYEYHGDIAGASGLRWYGGGGAYTGYYSFDNDGLNVDNSSSFSIGVAGVIGLEYKIKNIPLAISADWQPLYIVNGGGGFTSENGGIGIKYTF